MADAAPTEFKLNVEKLKKLQQKASSVVIGGKGVPRRKKKVVHKSAAWDDKKLQTTIRNLGINSIGAIEEVNMYKDDGEVIHFNNPKVQAAPSSNVFIVSGTAEIKSNHFKMSNFFGYNNRK